MTKRQGRTSGGFYPQITEVIRYLFVGALSSLTYFVTSNALDYLRAPVYISASVAVMLNTAVGYFGHMAITYRVTPQHLTMLPRFIVLVSVCIAFAVAVTYFVRDALGFPYFVASLSVMTLVPVFSFPIGKFWVFRVERPTVADRARSLSSDHVGVAGPPQASIKDSDSGK